MNYYLSKYVGKYRLKAIIDPYTNDFLRDYDGEFETGDIYIKCNNDIQIKYYGKGTLICYVPSVMRGHNILKKMATELGFDLETYGNPFNYEKLYDDLISTKTLSYVSETDEEMVWKFKDKYLELMFKFITPQTYGASISPFSPKNLSTRDYEIDSKDAKEYSDIMNSLDQKGKLAIGRFTVKFIKEVIPQNHRKYKNKDMEILMRKEQLRGKEYIHFIGFWDEFIKYIKRELKNMEEENVKL